MQHISFADIEMLDRETEIEDKLKGNQVMTQNEIPNGNTMENEARLYRKLKALTPRAYRRLCESWLINETKTFDELLTAFDATVDDETIDDGMAWGEPLAEDARQF